MPRSNFLMELPFDSADLEISAGILKLFNNSRLNLAKSCLCLFDKI
jgi:hypothetical protein